MERNTKYITVKMRSIFSGNGLDLWFIYRTFTATRNYFLFGEPFLLLSLTSSKRTDLLVMWMWEIKKFLTELLFDEFVKLRCFELCNMPLRFDVRKIFLIYLKANSTKLAFTPWLRLELKSLNYLPFLRFLCRDSFSSSRDFSTVLSHLQAHEELRVK